MTSNIRTNSLLNQLNLIHLDVQPGIIIQMCSHIMTIVCHDRVAVTLRTYDPDHIACSILVTAIVKYKQEIVICRR